MALLGTFFFHLKKKKTGQLIAVVCIFKDFSIRPMKPRGGFGVYSEHFPAIRIKVIDPRHEVLGDDSVRLRHEDVDRRLPAPG